MTHICVKELGQHWRIGDKPLSEPVLTYCQSDPREHISMKHYLKFKCFIQEMHLKMPFAQRQLFCLGLNVLKWEWSAVIPPASKSKVCRLIMVQNNSSVQIIECDTTYRQFHYHFHTHDGEFPWDLYPHYWLACVSKSTIRDVYYWRSVSIYIKACVRY